MTKIYLFLILCSTALQACSQTPATNNPATNNTTTTTTPAPKPQPEAYKSDKAGWLVDLDEAYAISIKEKKPIMANFTGSDWCGWCKRLDASVFSKPEFQTWAKKNVVLLELDFPRGKQLPQKNREQNAAMQNALQVSGYPTVWVFNLDKNPESGQYQINGLGKTGYTPTVEEFIATADKFVHP
ncbi:MAG TPA: thioredoxin family protein [Saprospiraceae bacterium]|nr:thioredoxin family protein [Saprospiraceae bacterium]